tara:strand:- start:433 stop:849 length:417 start_codon:yes stop_codon:yes gene_type:complete
MENGLKEKSFSFVYWVMLLLLVGDTLDTLYRFVFIGYLGGGSTFPGLDYAIKPTSVDLVVFLMAQVFIIYGIYLLYNLRKIGGYWFIGSQLFFLIYASFFGPIAEIGFSNILLPIVLFFCLYVMLVIIVPWFYSDKFN